MDGVDVPVTRARFRVKRYGKALAITVYGLVTLDAIRDVRQIIVCEAATRPTAKALVDLRAAIMLLDADDWRELRTTGDNIPAVPSGLIVQPENHAAASAHCDHMTAAGRMRFAFSAEPSELALALAWSGLPPGALRDVGAEKRRSLPGLPRPPALLGP